jgi:hypothetical protein
MLEVIIAELPNGWQIVVDGEAVLKHAHAYDAYHHVIYAMTATMDVAGSRAGMLVVTWEIHTRLGALEVEEVRRATSGELLDAGEVN